jgi:hypothetical protein
MLLAKGSQLGALLLLCASQPLRNETTAKVAKNFTQPTDLNPTGHLALTALSNNADTQAPTSADI